MEEENKVDNFQTIKHENIFMFYFSFHFHFIMFSISYFGYPG